MSVANYEVDCFGEAQILLLVKAILILIEQFEILSVVWKLATLTVILHLRSIVNRYICLAPNFDVCFRIEKFGTSCALT